MAGFKDIIGHEHIIEHLKRAITTDKVSHAYIFSGEDGAGKNMLANAFAMGLQCKDFGEEKDVCHRCTSCLSVEAGNHPDIIRVTHEKASIGVDDIRIQINNDILIKPYSSPYKIYIIDEAEKLTEQAQNALLKTIEEPPSYGIILLLTNNTSTLLPTILSRCITLTLQPVDKDKIKEYLMTHYKIPDYLSSLSCLFAGGNVGRAISYASSEEFSNRRDKAIHLLKFMDTMKIYEMVEEIKGLSEEKDKIYEYLDFFMLWYRDVLLFKATKNPNLLTYRNEVAEITKCAAQKSYEGIQSILDSIEKAKVRLRANVNFDITMELMLFTIKETKND